MSSSTTRGCTKYKKQLIIIFKLFFKTFAKIIGEDFNWDEIYITVKVAYIFYVIFFLLAAPFVVIIDVIFRNADIIFVSPTGMSIFDS